MMIPSCRNLLMCAIVIYLIGCGKVKATAEVDVNRCHVKTPKFQRETINAMGITYQRYSVSHCWDTEGNELHGFSGWIANCPGECTPPCGSRNGNWIKKIYKHQVLYQDWHDATFKRIDVPLVCECILNTDTR